VNLFIETSIEQEDVYIGEDAVCMSTTRVVSTFFVLTDGKRAATQKNLAAPEKL
jgi:hypothetical protein